MMKCKYCGSEIKEGEYFCPNCSAVAPVKRTHKEILLRNHDPNKLRSIAYIGAVFINALLCILWFCKCFTIGSTIGSVSMSIHNTFIGSNSVLSILTVFLYIASVIILLLFMFKKNIFPGLIAVPGITCIWSLIWFLAKAIKVGNISRNVGFSFTSVGWLFIIICVILIPLLAYILKQYFTETHKK